MTKVHVLPELRELAKEFGQPLADADGIAEVWLDNVDAWKEVTTDPEFVAKILRKSMRKHMAMSLEANTS